MVELIGINKFFNKNHVLKDLNLTIEDGEFLTLLGPSGCGKTTTLRLIAGLEKPESGRIVIDGVETDNGATNRHLDPSKRNLSMVFQSYALWPHMTVFQNVAFGLDMKRLSKSAIQESVDKALLKMHIPELAKRYPAELSGGQQQRVALARAIVTEPRLLLLDEPLSNLDAKLSMEMRGELKRLHSESGTTIAYVTHNQQEALTLSSRIAVFFDGELVQTARPRDLYRKPQTLQVADFIGNSSLNLLEARYEEGMLTSAITSTHILPDAPLGRDVIVAIKPEDVRLHRRPTAEAAEAVITAVYPQGPTTQLQLESGGQTLMALTVGEDDFEIDSAVFVTYNVEKITIYDKCTGRMADYKIAVHTPYMDTKEDGI